MLWWTCKQEWKDNRDHSYNSQFQIAAITVLISPVPFFGFYFDKQVSSLQIFNTVLYTTELQTPFTILPRFPLTVVTLPEFWNVSTHFCYPCTHSAIIRWCWHNRQKLVTYRTMLLPFWANSTWQVASHLSHSAVWELNNPALYHKKMKDTWKISMRWTTLPPIVWNYPTSSIPLLHSKSTSYPGATWISIKDEYIKRLCPYIKRLCRSTHLEVKELSLSIQNQGKLIRWSGCFFDVSAVQGHLVAARYRSRDSDWCPRLNPDHRRCRHMLAHKHQNWSHRYFSHVLFADESIASTTVMGMLWVFRGVVKRLVDCCIIETSGICRHDDHRPTIDSSSSIACDQCWWFQIWGLPANMRQWQRWCSVSLGHRSGCLGRYPAASRRPWTVWTGRQSQLISSAPILDTERQFFHLDTLNVTVFFWCDHLQ